VQDRAYVETSNPSSYHDARPQAEMQARREWTRAESLSMVRPPSVLAVEPRVLKIVHAYIRHRVMPVDRAGDGGKTRACQRPSPWRMGAS
jgi:hypothetical protein